MKPQSRFAVKYEEWCVLNMIKFRCFPVDNNIIDFSWVVNNFYYPKVTIKNFYSTAELEQTIQYLLKWHCLTSLAPTNTEHFIAFFVINLLSWLSVRQQDWHSLASVSESDLFCGFVSKKCLIITLHLLCK